MQVMRKQRPLVQVNSKTLHPLIVKRRSWVSKRYSLVSDVDFNRGVVGVFFFF